ncbi:acetyl-CoA carboxylase biotin carboxylase subunit family protein [Burkholderia sp. Ed8]|uniref:ATP-grasp domain-containing protein n=1 Tax=Burkholderia sp. Ed8 TaxID=3112957 RepID=UPI00345DC5B3
MKPIIIVESSCVGARYTGQAAQAIGYRPVFMTDPGFGQGETHEQMAEFEVVHCDTGDASAMQTALRERGIDDAVAAISMCDTNIMSAVELAERLDILSINKHAKALKDKGYVYDLIPEYSPPSVVLDAQQIPFDAIAHLLEKHGRVLFKAACSAGGHGSFFIDAIDEEAIAAKIRDSGIPAHLHPNSWLAQAAIDGRLVSLEGYTHEGRIRFLGFSGRRKIGMTESVVIFPVDDELPAPLADQAKAAVTSLLARSGFTNGYFHVEFMLGGDRAYLIDANVGRIGGGGLSEQFAVAYGTTPEEVYKHILLLSLQGTDAGGAALYAERGRKTWSAMYGIPVQASIRNITLPDGFPNYHIRILEYGTSVSPMGVDNYSWIGIVSGEAEQVEKYTPEIEIETSEGRYHAVF